MKKFFFLSAIALLGLATACVDQQPVNPNFNAERGEVKTDFTINVATPVATKVSEETAQAQATPVFRGMNNMTLFVLKGDPAPAAQDETPADFETNKYDLGTLTSGEITATQSSKIYNLTFPTGVKNMVFYAKATPNGTDANANGKITWPSTATKKADVVFGLSPIAESTDEFTAEANKIQTALNTVVTAFGTTTAEGYDVNLKKAYDLFTKISSSELRLGSAAGVKRMITDLRKTVVNLKAGQGASTDFINLCDAILAAIDRNFTDGIVSGVEEDFPADLGLPEGAAQLTFSNGAFAYATTHGAVDGATATAITKYAYPVELCYWVSSAIRTSEDPDITADMYPTTVANWEAWSGWGDVQWTDKGTITSGTRAVALRENIQYANALMKTTIQYDDEKDLQDNNAKFNEGEENNTVDKKFAVKGILVGKQPAQVAWNFKDASNATRENVIYDNVFDAYAIPTTKPLYTMVFDNYTTSTAANDKVVNIAVELVNNTGKDFWGKDNLIPNGGTFYLAAQLDLATLKTVPEGVESVFVQDYMTSVKLKIGEKSLQSAYATVPDLRSVAMTFGLSVDLTWQAGAEFEIEFGGQTATTGGN